MFVGKSFDNTVAGDVGDARSAVEGSGGSSGMAGTAGKLSFAFAVAESEPPVVVAAAEFGVAAVAVGGAAELGVAGHAGAPLSVASEAPFVVVNGGTPSGDWL